MPKKQASTTRGKRKKREIAPVEIPESQENGSVASTTAAQKEESVNGPEEGATDASSEEKGASASAEITEDAPIAVEEASVSTEADADVTPEEVATEKTSLEEVPASSEADADSSPEEIVASVEEVEEAVTNVEEVTATIEAPADTSETVAEVSDEAIEAAPDAEAAEEVTATVEESKEEVVAAASSEEVQQEAEKVEEVTAQEEVVTTSPQAEAEQPASSTPEEAKEEAPVASEAEKTSEVVVEEFAVKSAEAGLPAPKKPLSPLWIGLYMLASLIGGLSSVCIKQVMLPLQVQHLDPKNFYISFAIVASLGAAAGLIASPLSGALSDRTTSRLGRRRPWIIGSVVTLGIGLIIMAFSPNIPVLLIGEIIAQLGADALLATTTAIIPDQVPPVQRSIIAAFNGMAPIVGGTIGLLLVTRLTNPNQSTTQGYILLAIVSLVLVGLFLLVLRERQLPKESVAPFRASEFFGSFVIRPKQYPGFLYVIISRFLIFLSFTILGAFSLYYFQGLNIPNAKVLAPMNVAQFQLISGIFVVIGAIAGGWLSKRADRLKPFVITGALLMAIALIIIGIIPSWDVIRITAAVFGTGFGLYLGVDVALAVRVLPNTKSSGKDLGILHIAIFLALVLSPIFGSGTLQYLGNNFTIVFGLAALSSLVGAVLILPVRSAR